MEPTRRFKDSNDLRFDHTLIEPGEDGYAQIVLTNPTGITRKLRPGTWVGRASGVEMVIQHSDDDAEDAVPNDAEELVAGNMQAAEGVLVNPEPCVAGVNNVDAERRVHFRKEKLSETLADEGSNLPPEERERLHSFLLECHEAFSLEKSERGETDLVELQIDTGDASPIKQQVRRMPFAVRQEVARQLREMQRAGVIRPSNSPWASPVVLVRKKDGSLRFCIDFRALNSITKPDTFPLPRIDDLLDQLGRAKHFSTLDLASGFWQIKLHAESREKTAFITPQGLFEFQVMPFGLTNAPAVFQRLMQQVLMGLNPPEGPDFVSVHIDDILIYSETLEDHLEHLKCVIERLMTSGLKLKPMKCHFVRQEVEYLGHIITPTGLKPNPKTVYLLKMEHLKHACSLYVTDNNRHGIPCMECT